MKLCTNSSIHGCQARLPRADGALLFGSVALGEGFASGVGDTSIGVGEGLAVAAIVGVGDACTTSTGVALTAGVGATSMVGWGEGVGVARESDFFERRDHIVKPSTATTTIAQTVAGVFRIDLCPVGASIAGAAGCVAPAEEAGVAPPLSSAPGPSNSFTAATRGGICLESGGVSASSQCGVLR